jgi:hypothetical protein
MVGVQAECTACLFPVPERPSAAPDLQHFRLLHNLISSSTPPTFFHENVIIYEEDAERLEGELQANLKLPKEFQRSVRSIKQESMERILQDQPCRRSHQANSSSSSPRILATVSIMDLTSMAVAAGCGPFPVEPYILVRDEFPEMVNRLESLRHAYLSGQPKTGKLEPTSY